MVFEDSTDGGNTVVSSVTIYFGLFFSLRNSEGVFKSLEHIGEEYYVRIINVPNTLFSEHANPIHSCLTHIASFGTRVLD